MLEPIPILLAALIMDALLGEPPWLWSRAPHPAVLMGRAVAFLDRLLNHGGARLARGVLATAILTLGAGALGWGIQTLPFGDLWTVLITAILLAQRSLADHVTAVAQGLEASLDEGRQAVSMIVGRDPESLDESGVARAAVESAAENFSDGVVAPAFWLLVGGLPGLMIYKTINTADSMIGHRNARYDLFGRAAARLDDALNWIPARLSALLIALAAGSTQAARVAWRDARLHKSPNAGWPEAAMAAALGLALAGPRRYQGALTPDPWLHPEGRRQAGPADIRAAVGMIWRAWGVLLAGGLAFALASSV